MPTKNTANSSDMSGSASADAIKRPGPSTAEEVLNLGVPDYSNLSAAQCEELMRHLQANISQIDAESEVDIKTLESFIRKAEEALTLDPSEEMRARLNDEGNILTKQLELNEKQMEMTVGHKTKLSQVILTINHQTDQLTTVFKEEFNKVKTALSNLLEGETDPQNHLTERLYKHLGYVKDQQKTLAKRPSQSDLLSIESEYKSEKREIGENLLADVKKVLDSKTLVNPFLEGTTSKYASGNVEPKGICENSGANSGFKYEMKKLRATVMNKGDRLFEPGERTAIFKMYEGKKVTKHPQILTLSDRIEADWMAIGQRKDGSVLFKTKDVDASTIKVAILPYYLANNEFPLGKAVGKDFEIKRGIGSSTGSQTLGRLISEEQNFELIFININNMLAKNNKNITKVEDARILDTAKVDEPIPVRGAVLYIDNDEAQTHYIRQVVEGNPKQRCARIIPVPKELIKKDVKIGEVIEISRSKAHGVELKTETKSPRRR